MLGSDGPRSMGRRSSREVLVARSVESRAVARRRRSSGTTRRTCRRQCEEVWRRSLGRPLRTGRLQCWANGPEFDRCRAEAERRELWLEPLPEKECGRCPPTGWMALESSAPRIASQGQVCLGCRLAWVAVVDRLRQSGEFVKLGRGSSPAEPDSPARLTPSDRFGPWKIPTGSEARDPPSQRWR